MNKLTVTFIVGILISLSSSANIDLHKLTPKQKIKLSAALQVLIDSGALNVNESQPDESKLTPGLLQMLESEGILEVKKSSTQSICIGPL